MSEQNHPFQKIILFASGSGSNVENIVQYFKNEPRIKIAAVLTNNSKAGVIDRCKRLKIPLICFNREAFYESDLILKLLEKEKPDLIVLAGFLWKVPETLIASFTNRIINIHPALLPKYGGKGMYGSRVHEAVVKNRERFSGITIHYVNENYDEGAVIEQHQIELSADETPESLASRIHQLEYEFFPRVIASLLVSKNHGI